MRHIATEALRFAAALAWLVFWVWATAGTLVAWGDTLNHMPTSDSLEIVAILAACWASVGLGMATASIGFGRILTWDPSRAKASR